MSYYWFYRENILKDAWNKCHNKEGKQIVGKCYVANKEILREDARNKYRNLTEKEKDKKNEISKKKIPHEY